MPYTPKTWADGYAGGTPITAADLNHIENGLAGTTAKADAAATKAALAAVKTTADAAATKAALAAVKTTADAAATKAALAAVKTTADAAVTKAQLSRALAGVSSLPVGVVQMWAGTSIPSGWLECNGQAVSRTAYSALYSAVGTAFGSGNGSSTFNVPDLRGRVPVGPGSNGITRASKGGEATHTLTEKEMPSHRHEVCQADNGNRHVAQYQTDAGQGSKWGLYSYVDSLAGSRLIANNTGGSQPHNNMQPYLGIVFIIKAA